MKKQLLILALFLNALMCFAQEGEESLKNYADFKKRTLMVIVEEVNPELVAKLDQRQVEVYIKEIEEYNSLVKWAMDTYYKVGNPVEYKSTAEIKSFVDKKEKAYAFISYSKFGFYKTKLAFEMTQKNRLAKERSRLGSVLSLNFLLSRLEIRLAEESKDANPLYSQYMPTPFPNKADMAYAFRQITAMLNDREQGITRDLANKQVKKDAKKVQSQTLLVTESDVDTKEDKAKFISSYKYPVEIVPVDSDKVSEAIISGNAQYATVITIPMYSQGSDKIDFKFFLYDCGSGKTVATSVPQDKTGISTGTIWALRSLKKTATESSIPPLRKENMMDFRDAIN